MNAFQQTAMSRKVTLGIFFGQRSLQCDEIRPNTYNNGRMNGPMDEQTDNQQFLFLLGCDQPVRDNNKISNIFPGQF